MDEENEAYVMSVLPGIGKALPEGIHGLLIDGVVYVETLDGLTLEEEGEEVLSRDLQVSDVSSWPTEAQGNARTLVFLLEFENTE